MAEKRVITVKPKSMKQDLFEYAERMRCNPTFHEKIMANKLDLAGIQYQTQWVIGKYIVDFIFQQKMLIIEIDGESHDLNFDYDRERDNYLRSRGYKVVRIKNADTKNYNVGWIKSTKNKGKKRTWGQLTEDERTKIILSRPCKVKNRGGKQDKLAKLHRLRESLKPQKSASYTIGELMKKK